MSGARCMVVDRRHVGIWQNDAGRHHATVQTHAGLLCVDGDTAEGAAQNAAHAARNADEAWLSASAEEIAARRLADARYVAIREIGRAIGLPDEAAIRAANEGDAREILAVLKVKCHGERTGT